MKRKLFLLPIALTTLTPMVSMVGCNKINFEDYQVTDEEFAQIISLTDVKLMQVDTKNFDTNTTELISERHREYSDNVYYAIKHSYIDDSHYIEKYVMRHSGPTDTYTKIERYDPQGQWGQEVVADKDEFFMPGDEGVLLVDIYNRVISRGLTFSFSKSKKCYFAVDRYDTETETLEYYFYKKKIVQFNAFGDGKPLGETKITYDQIIPVPPDPRNP